MALDPTPFLGLESVADAVEHLHSGRSIGKVFSPSFPLCGCCAEFLFWLVAIDEGFVTTRACIIYEIQLRNVPI